MEWKNIVVENVEEGRYQISEDGHIRDVVRNREVAQHVDNFGYVRTRLTQLDHTQKVFQVHRLVALSFIPPVEGKKDVDHIDGNKTNNHVSNLRWATRQENVRNPSTFPKHLEKHAVTEAVLSQLVICEETGKTFPSMTAAAKEYGISMSAVTQSCEKYAQGKPRRPAKFGKPVMHFHLLQPEAPITQRDSEETIKRSLSKPNAKKVRCIETGEVFPSSSAAARAYGLRTTSVSGSCNRMAAGGRKSKAFGLRTCYHFEWVLD